jgi:LmeA-like phospholipid-binding
VIQNGGDLGEQALSKIAELGIANQLDEVEDINVAIKTDPLKLVQGEVESVSIEGKGMVMQKDLRMEEMSLQADAIAINPLSAVFGNIELTRPTQATATVVLTEADINRAFNSDYIRSKLQNLQMTVNGKPTQVDTRQVEFQLQDDRRVRLTAEVVLANTGETHQIAFLAVPRVQSDQQKVVLDDVEYSQGEGLSPELTEAMLAQAQSLLDLRNFELKGTKLILKQLDIESGKLTLSGDAFIEEFPST